MKTASWLLMVLAMVGVLAQGADAYTVAGWSKGGFADFSKAIVFTSASCPSNAETAATSGGAKTCAIPMRPVGDGSWVCTATVIKGVSYTYYFEYRIPIYDSTTVYTDSQNTYVWRNAPATGSRDNDVSKGITVPASAQAGYVFYNIFGDNTVRGVQGIDKTGSWDTELTIANPYVARYLGVDDVDNTTDNDTGNFSNPNGNNNFGMTATQTSDTSVLLSWTLGHGGSDGGFVPSVEGAREFDTQSSLTPYGFKILRARITSANGTTAIKNLIFEDTVVNQVKGETLYSPSRTTLGIGWYNSAITFTDTSVPTNTGVGDTFIYVVLFRDAYGNQNDTGEQDFAGGSATWVRGANVDVLFMVEKFDPNVVFPDGSTSGMVHLTPYVNGIPNPFRSIKARAFVAKRAG